MGAQPKSVQSYQTTHHITDKPANMPHKHKRKRGEDPDFDLPPSQRARPLPVGVKGKTAPQTKPKRQARFKDNDAPRAFRRIMAAAQGKKFPGGLDDGQPKGKKTPVAKSETEPEKLAIRPGEDLRSFSARVDAALPVSGLKTKTVVRDGKDEQGNKVWRTRKELKMHRLYDQWRAEERKAKERHEEELELEAEKELENDGEGITSSSFMKTLDEAGEHKGSRRKGKKGRAKEKEEDPWAALKKNRAEAKIGLHDVALAPPELNKKKERQLQVKEGAMADVEGIPKAAGSLRRREELQAERDAVLEAYRQMRDKKQATSKSSSKSPP